MADPELEALRAKRLAQLQGERGIQRKYIVLGKKTTNERIQLPKGRKTHEVVRKKEVHLERKDIYVTSPGGKMFPSKKELQKYIDEKKLKLKIEQFYFSSKNVKEVDLENKNSSEEGGDGVSNQKAAEERKRETEEMKNSILSQVLDQSARARLNTLMLGKPEKGRMVENMLLQMAQRGQIMGRLGENELIGILEQVSEKMPQTRTTVKFDRRRAALDDSDDDL